MGKAMLRESMANRCSNLSASMADDNSDAGNYRAERRWRERIPSSFRSTLKFPLKSAVFIYRHIPMHKM